MTGSPSLAPEQWYQQVLPEHRVVAHCRTYEVALGLVHAGFGVCLLPALTAFLAEGVKADPRCIYAVVSSIRSTRFAREGAGANGSAKYCVSWATSPSRNSMMLTV